MARILTSTYFTSLSVAPLFGQVAQALDTCLRHDPNERFFKAIDFTPAKRSIEDIMSKDVDTKLAEIDQFKDDSISYRVRGAKTPYLLISYIVSEMMDISKKAIDDPFTQSAYNATVMHSLNNVVLENIDGYKISHSLSWYNTLANASIVTDSYLMNFDIMLNLRRAFRAMRPLVFDSKLVLPKVMNQLIPEKIILENGFKSENVFNKPCYTKPITITGFLNMESPPSDTSSVESDREKEFSLDATLSIMVGFPDNIVASYLPRYEGVNLGIEVKSPADPIEIDPSKLEIIPIVIIPET
jgi:hypothetical protein